MENTTENNILFAEFLQACKNGNGTFEFPQFGKLTIGGTFKTEFRAERLIFHKDWNWLMQVVEKIESLKTHSIYIKTNGCTIQDKNGKLFCVWLCREDNVKTKIQAVYNACVEFVKWYNQQKQ